VTPPIFPGNFLVEGLPYGTIFVYIAVCNEMVED